MAADALERLRRAGRRQASEIPYEVRRARRRLAAAAVRAADRALHPRPRPGAARARLLRRRAAPRSRPPSSPPPIWRAGHRRARPSRASAPSSPGWSSCAGSGRGSTDFSLDASASTSAIAELEAGGEVAAGEIEVIVPLRGLQMPIARLELATATIVRADTVDVPARGAGRATGSGGRRLGARLPRRDPRQRGRPATPTARPLDAGARAVEAFRQLVTTLRLFKAGGVGLGPYAWTRAGGDRWRRIATGAGRPRPGGYRLAEDGARRPRRLLARPRLPLDPVRRAARRARRASRARSARAISRFEAGLERNVVARGAQRLSARPALRARGRRPGRARPADAGRRAVRRARAARRDQGGRRPGRRRWSASCGAASPPATGEGAATPAETAAAVEDLARAILKDAACGHLGTDLRATADEILLADGLAVGEGAAEQRGGPRSGTPLRAESTADEATAGRDDREIVRSTSSRRLLQDEPRSTTTRADADETPEPEPGLEGQEPALDRLARRVARGRAGRRARAACRCRSPKGESRSSHTPA